MVNRIPKATLWACFLLLFSMANANAIEINNVQRLSSPNQDRISFELSWQNSWNVIGTPGNHDAAWIFIKYRECGGLNNWEHALLSTSFSDHSLDPNLAFADSISVNDRLGNPGNHNTGALIRRSAFGTGHNVSLPCTLRVVGGSGGAVFSNGVDYDIRVFGIEMVQVLEGAFGAGDNGLELNSFRFTTSVNDGTPAIIASEAPVTLWDGACGARTLPANYPKGYAEYYVMKYEISQGQYADFLNTINGLAASQRFAGNYNVSRYRITSGGGEYFSERRDRACNFLSWSDVGSYLDWAALRPMTELEYEKACKGDGQMGPLAFAWGNPFYIEAQNVSGTENGTEFCTDLNANINTYGLGLDVVGGDYATPLANLTRGPVGCGIFARDSSLTRETTGATYYGIMEMSGNVFESVVTIHRGDSSCGVNPTYDGVWGDGLLNSSGHFNTNNWPIASASQNSAIGLRGGSWDFHQRYGHVGNRYYIRYGGPRLVTRHQGVGGRGVR